MKVGLGREKNCGVGLYWEGLTWLQRRGDFGGVVLFDDQSHAPLGSFGELDKIHQGMDEMNPETAWANIIEVATLEL